MFLQGQCEIENTEYRNSFFQMVTREDGVYIKYFPAKAGGSILNIEEFRDYLKLHKIKFDPGEFSKQIFIAREPVLMKTENSVAKPVAETMNVKVRDNGLIASCRFIPPSTGGNLLSKEEILASLDQQGIKFGIDEESIDNYLQNRVFGTDYTFARGVTPINGTDGRVEQKITMDVNRKPKEREDGTVDFFSLDIIPKVEKGDVVAELFKEIEGTPGMDVKGKVLPPLKVKKLRVKLGNNVSVTEDGQFVISEVSGHMVVDDEKIDVSNTFIVNGDCDTSTGNIDYDGNVEIMGSVISGIRITVSGDVTIYGTVEGAIIEAGGHIILQNGIKGMGKGSIRAGGNIVARYIESVTAEAGGYVIADTILNSHIVAKDDVIVHNRKGYVNGGFVSSATSIKIKNAGSEMGTRTILEVGIDPALLQELKNVELKKEWVNKKMESAYPLIELYGKKIKRGEKLPPEKLVQFKIMTLGYKKHSEEFHELQAQIDEISQSIANHNGGSIEIMDTAYPGVRIVVVNAVMNIKTVMKNSRFIREGADVKILSLV